MSVANPKANSKTLIVLAVVAGLLLLGGIGSYVLLASQLGTASQQLAAKTKEEKDGQMIASRLATAERQLAETQIQLSCLEGSVSTYEFVPTLLQQLEQLGKKNNLRVLAVRPIPAPPPPPVVAKPAGEGEGSEAAKPAKKPEVKPYEELKINIEVEGNYWSTRNFLTQLTSFPKIIAVNELSLMPSDVLSTKNSSKLQVKLNVTVFIFQKDAPPSKATGTPTTTAGVERRPGNEG